MGECRVNLDGTCLEHKEEATMCPTGLKSIRGLLSEAKQIIHAAYLLDRVPLAGTEGLTGQQWFEKIKKWKKDAEEALAQ